MGKRYFYVFTGKMYYRIYTLRCHIVIQQVFQSVTAYYTTAVIIYRQPGIQVSIVAEHRFNKLRTKMIIEKQSIVRLKIDERSVFFVGNRCRITDKLTSFKHSLTHLSFANTSGDELYA